MDKCLTLAVAGSGKTRLLIEKLNLEQHFLIITHTNNNYYNLKSRIIKKFGFLPDNVKIYTYFSFLYSFCFRPLLGQQLGVKGISYDKCRNMRAWGNARYINSFKKVYSNRLGKLIEVKGAADDVVRRLSKYFDVIMIDEVQDFSAHDFNFLEYITKAESDVFFVGDFFQHTFDTSTDGNVNINLHKDYSNYLKQYEKFGLSIDTETLKSSHRCSPQICNYVSSNLGIEIDSERKDITQISFIDSENDIKEICANDNIIKLFYQNSHSYHLYANNWGNSKGIDDYHDVCIALNINTFKHYRNGTLNSLNEKTRNKLYVALTRCRGNLYFVEERVLKSFLS